MEREIIMAPKKYNPIRNIFAFVSGFLCKIRIPIFLPFIKRGYRK